MARASNYKFLKLVGMPYRQNLKGVIMEKTTLEKVEKKAPSLVGISDQEMQAFLDAHTGAEPDEEAQGSVKTAIISIAMHC